MPDWTLLAPAIGGVALAIFVHLFARRLHARARRGRHQVAPAE